MDGVVILHGIFRTHRSMAGLAKFLSKQGYTVLNVGYPSTRMPIEKLIEHIHPQIETFAAGVKGKVHFVGYSMGGLLIRAYLHKFRPAQLGRVVMLGTPNGGSEVADFLQHISLFKKLYGPAGQQLVTAQDPFRSMFGAVDYELGVLAGSRSIDPISSYIIGKPGDGKVSIDSTRIEGMKDHIIIPVAHTLFPVSRRAWRHTQEFLAGGSFIKV